MGNAMGINRGSAIGLGKAVGSDIKQTILNVMKEISKTNKFIHKNDIYTVLQNEVAFSAFENALKRLEEDGTIYTTYDHDIYSLLD